MKDTQYNKKESVNARKEKATLRIKEKIAVLEFWKKSGIPEGYLWYEESGKVQKGAEVKGRSCPVNMSQFQKWEDKNLNLNVSIDGSKYVVNGVYKIAAVTMDKEWHTSLKNRAIELMTDLKKRPKPKQELSKLKAEIEILTSLTQNLVNDNAALRFELNEAKKNIAAKNISISNLSERVKALTDDLRKIKPINIHSV